MNLKKFFSLVLFLFCVSLLIKESHFVKVLHAETLLPFVGVITEDNVNIRAGQSSNFEKLTSLDKDAPVLVLDKSYSWYKIKLPKQSSNFISSKYLNFIDSKIAEVTANKVNVRARPTDKSSVLGQVNKGDKLDVIQISKDWVEIKAISNSYGWVSEEFIKFVTKDLSVLDQKKEEVVLNKKVEPSIIEKNEPIVTQETIIKKVKINGLLVFDKNAVDQNKLYRLEAANKTSIFLIAPAYVLNDFIDYQIEVEGTLNNIINSSDSSSTINVSKIQIML